MIPHIILIPVELPSSIYAAAAPNSDGTSNIYVNTAHPQEVQRDAVEELERRLTPADSPK